MIERKVTQSLVLGRVIPEYVENEFPRFVQFVRAYYKWLETDGNTVNMLNKFLSNRDIKTVDSKDHQFHILNTFLNSIPKNLNVDYANLLHNIRSFYSERGTESSIKAFFLMLNEIYRPNRLVVEWDEHPDLLIGEVVYGTNSGAKATIINATRVSESSDFVLVTVSYETASPYTTRFFTSVDSLRTEQGEIIPLRVEDFRATIFYPKDYILRSSDGVYQQEYRCRFKLPNGVYKDYNNKLFQTSSGNTGKIDRQSYMIGSKDGFDFYELTLSFSVFLGWTETERLFIDGEEINLAKVFSGVRIQTPGMGYTQGQRFRIKDTNDNTVGSVVLNSVQRSEITQVDVIEGGSGYQLYEKFRFKYSTGYYGGGYVRSVSSGVLTGLYVEQSRKNSTEYPTVEFESGNNTAVTFAYGSDVGAIREVVIEEVGFGVDTSSVVEVDTQTYPLQTAQLQVEVGTLYRTPLAFKDARGQLSSYFRLQDNYYWQDYSYVVQFNKPFDFESYVELYNKTVHPSGMKMFFEYRRAGDDAIMYMKQSASSTRILNRQLYSDELINKYAFAEIGSVERLKDVNRFHVFNFPFVTGTLSKSFVFDDYLRFSSDGLTVEEFNDMDTIHKYTNSIEIHPVYQIIA